MITLKQLKAKLSYSPIVGVFEWIRPGKKYRPGDLAGSVCKESGYIVIGLCGKKYRAHHLAWLYMTGEWPEQDIDHRDGDRANNAFLNLRQATKSQNQWNKKITAASTSGVKGVSFDKGTSKWRATVGLGDKRLHVGLFKTKAEAADAAMAKRDELHGEFANHGMHGFEREELENALL